MHHPSFCKSVYLDSYHFEDMVIGDRSASGDKASWSCFQKAADIWRRLWWDYQSGRGAARNHFIYEAFAARDFYILWMCPPRQRRRPVDQTVFQIKHHTGVVQALWIASKATFQRFVKYLWAAIVTLRGYRCGGFNMPIVNPWVWTNLACHVFCYHEVQVS